MSLEDLPLVLKKSFSKKTEIKDIAANQVIMSLQVVKKLVSQVPLFSKYSIIETIRDAAPIGSKKNEMRNISIIINKIPRIIQNSG